MRIKMKQALGILLSTAMALGMVLGVMPGMSLTAYAAGNVASVTVGETTTEYATLADAVDAWKTADNGATLTMLNDVSGTFDFDQNKTKTLDLNGKTLTLSQAITISAGTLTVQGTSGGEVKKDGRVFVINEAGLIVNGGTVSGTGSNDEAAIKLEGNGSTLTINDGTVRSNASNAIFLSNASSSTVNLNGGTVSNNLTDNTVEKAAVLVYNGSNNTINLTGTTITSTGAYGIASKNNTECTLIIKGGSIQSGNNYAVSNIGVIKLEGAPTMGDKGINVGSGKITVTGKLSNTNPIGVTMASPGVFTESATTDYNDATKFTSDNTSYAVGKNADGQLFLGTPISSVAVTGIDAPVATEPLDTAATTNTENVTLGVVSWSPATTPAAYATAYTATVIASPASTYAFADNATATVNGETATVTKNDDGTLSISNAFPKTALNPVTITSQNKEVTYSSNGIAIPVEGMFTISEGAGAPTYSVTNGTGEGTFAGGKLTVTKCGTFTVKVSTAETATHAAGAETSATLTVNKANAVAATVIADNRTYDGTEKPLVTVEGEPTGGEMQYALGTATEATEQYTTSIPAKTDAGTYYVWYKAKGDENHLDSAVAGPVTVTVSKKAVTVTANDQTVKEGGAIAAGADNAKLDGAADGHKLADVKLASSSTAAATTEGEIAPSDAVIKDGNGTDVTGNYEITYVKGKLTVTAEQKEPENQEDGTIKTDAHVDEKAPQTKVENLTPELAKSLLTEEEVKQLEEGATVLLYLDVKNIDETVSAEDKELTENKAKEISGGAKVGMYLDLSLFKKVGNNDSVKVSDTNGKKIRAVFEVPENLRGGADVIRTFYIARIHDGKIEILAQSTDTSIPVDSDLFSTYSLLFSDQPVYEGFVDRVYGVLLGRKVDPAGLASWKEALEKKEVTAAQVIEGVIYSSEYLANNKGELNKDDTNEVFVDKMYLAILNRKGDDEGKKIWLDLLEQGYSRKYVLAQFVNSGEFEKICTDAGYTKGKVALTEEEKTPDTNNKHIDAEQVKGFVTRLYTVVLGRDPDQEGLDYWVDQIVSRKKTPEWVATYGFFSSKEYLEKNKSATDFLTDNYAALMGRTPDAEGLKYWEDKLAGGMKREKVTSVGFGQSKEFSGILKGFGLK